MAHIQKKKIFKKRYEKTLELSQRPHPCPFLLPLSAKPHINSHPHLFEFH